MQIALVSRSTFYSIISDYPKNEFLVKTLRITRFDYLFGFGLLLTKKSKL